MESFLEEYGEYSQFIVLIIVLVIGVLAYGVWATVTALIGFGVLKATLGLRVSEEVEKNGLDEAEHGIGGFEGGGFEAWAKDNMK